MITTDVFIAGAGIAGSIAALSYAKSARNVIVADPFSYEESSKFDYRTTAYLQPSKLFLELIGCLLYTSPSPRDAHESRMPSSA